MKKTILIGTILATTTLITMVFTSTVSAQSAEQMKFIEEVKEKQIENMNWIPGSLTGIIIILYLLFWKIGTTILLNLWNSSRF